MLGVFETQPETGEIVEAIRVPRLSPRARWGYYKVCRKTGEFAHAIGAFVRDPARSSLPRGDRRHRRETDRADDAEGAVHPCQRRGCRHRFGIGAQNHETRGLSDPIDQQVHLAVLRRAIGQADGRENAGRSRSTAAM